MRYNLRWFIVPLLLLTLTVSVAGQPMSRMESEYNRVAALFEQRDKLALRELRDYIEAYPYTTFEAEVYFMQGVIQTERGYYKKAIKEFDKSDYKTLPRPYQPQYQFYRGYAHLMLQEYDRASTFFSNLEKHDTEYKEKAAYYYAYCQYKLGNYDKAVPTLLELEKKDAYQKTVPYYLTQIYYSRGLTDDVRQRAERLLAEQPENENNVELHRILGEMHFTDGRYGDAVAELTTYDKMNTEQQREPLRSDLYMLGLAQYKTSDYAAAIATFKRVPVQEDSISENVSLSLGHAYRQLGDNEQAKLAYLDATHYNIDPQVHYEAMYNYALAVYQSSSSIGESESVFTDFIRQYPNSEHIDEIYMLLSNAFRKSKNYKAALAALDSIDNPNKQLRETKQYLRYQLGTDAFVQNKFADAVTSFTAVIEDPTPSSVLTDTYYWRAEANYRLKDMDACQRDLVIYFSRPDVAQSPNRAAADYLQGYVSFGKKNYEGARAAFERHVAALPSNAPTYADALNRIGDCCFNARQFADAAKAYEKVAALNTDGSDYALFQQGYSLGLMKQPDEKVKVLQQLANKYPKSDYADDALYEIARVRMAQERNAEAVKSYETLLNKYPRSNLARSASLERAMAYRNMKDYDHAITAYKHTIEHYPASKEAYMAVEGLEAVCLETNRVNDYIAYTKKLSKLNMQIATKDDSLAYVAAEMQLRQGNVDAALAQFAPLADRIGSPYAEPSAMQSAELYYERKDYANALPFYRKWLVVASSRKNMTTARVGVMRCTKELKETKEMMDMITNILGDEPVDAAVKEEALYTRAKTNFDKKDYAAAIPDLTKICTDVRTAVGAEAKYLLAQAYYNLGELDKAENEVMSFAQQPTQQQYWLARSLIVLADVSHRRGDDFQAQQYLLSLKANYTNKDDILQRVEDKLNQLAPKSVEQPKEEED